MPYADPTDQAAAARRHYLANRDAMIARAKANTIARRNQLREVIRQVKDVPCADCGHRFPTVCMDFDHMDGHDKDGDIATMVARAVGMKRLLAEIAKCEVVCACCHRLRTELRSAQRSGAVGSSSAS